jgi:hypothetical protein
VGEWARDHAVVFCPLVPLAPLVLLLPLPALAAPQIVVLDSLANALLHSANLAGEVALRQQPFPLYFNHSYATLPPMQEARDRQVSIAVGAACVAL